jgi:hypothetical protein
MPVIPLPRQFSADVERSDGESSRVFHDGALSRIECYSHGATTVTICRPDRGVIYELHLEERSFYEIPFLARRFLQWTSLNLRIRGSLLETKRLTALFARNTKFGGLRLPIASVGFV